MSRKASEAIKDAICDGGTPVSQCGFCHCTHYGNGRDMDEGEWDRLEKKRDGAPEFFKGHDYDSISIGQIEGTNYVWNCGCEQSEERLSRIENFLWGHQRIIDSYYKRRIKDMKEEAATREKMVSP